MRGTSLLLQHVAYWRSCTSTSVAVKMECTPHTRTRGSFGEKKRSEAACLSLTFMEVMKPIIKHTVLLPLADG